MILRRIASAIKRQDWFVVFIEIVIVVIGVYIGIYLGDIQTERKLLADTNRALEALEDELRSDLERLDEVIAHQTNMVAVQQRAVGLLGADELDEAVIGPLFDFILGANDTFFPNRSAYKAMQTGGFLEALPDEALRLQITRLVEREYERIDFNANSYDEITQVFGLSILPNYWDRARSKLLKGDPGGAVKIQNGVMHVNGMGEFYLGLVTDLVRPEMIKTLQMIDAYQGEGEAE